MGLPGPIGPFGGNGVDRVFVIGDGTADNNRSNLFSIDNLGNIRTKGSGGAVMGGGADYGEYFEAESGSYPIPVGTTVVINPKTGKIVPTDQAIFHDICPLVPFGVISNTPMIIGNSADEEWVGKYMRNEDGSLVFEDNEISIDEPEFEEIEKNITETKLLEVKDSYGKTKCIEIEETKIVIGKVPKVEKIPIYNQKGDFLRWLEKPITKKVTRIQRKPKINPEFDPNQLYISRKARPEWHVVGLLGQIKIKKGQITHPNWTLIKEGDQFNLWLVK